MVIKIEVHLGIGLGNAAHSDTLEVEVDDGAGPHEIEESCEEEYNTWLQGYLDTGWSFSDGRERIS
jgi:TusA-related sulfurtransferase